MDLRKEPADQAKAAGGEEKHANGRLSMPRWYLLLAIVGSMLALSVAGVLYTNYAIKKQNVAERESDRRWCQLLGTLDDAYRAAPPQSETGRRLAADIHNLRQELGCG